MTELEYLEAINNALTLINNTLMAQNDSFAGVIAASGAVVVSLFALGGCLIGFFSGIELLKIWRT